MVLDPSMQKPFHVGVAVVMALSVVAFYVCRHVMRTTTGIARWLAFAGILLSTVGCSGSFIFAQVVQFGPPPPDGYKPYVEERSSETARPDKP